MSNKQGYTLKNWVEGVSDEALYPLEKLAKFFCLKIGRNENFIMQMSYGDKKIFNISFLLL